MTDASDSSREIAADQLTVINGELALATAYAHMAQNPRRGNDRIHFGDLAYKSCQTALDLVKNPLLTPQHHRQLNPKIEQLKTKLAELNWENSSGY